MLSLLNKIPTILMLVSPILITATAGMICERSGVVNIALEGLMVFGAFATATVHFFTEVPLGGFSIWFAILCGGVFGMIFSLIHAFASVSLNADQTISGTGINLLAVGVTRFISQIIFKQEQTKEFMLGMMPSFAGIYPTAYVALIIILLAWFILYKRPLGLRLRSCGENPQAAASVGINVQRIRYMAVLTSGFLAGIAGGCLVLTTNTQFNSTTVNGHGFIALAVVSFGRWRPIGITGAAILFGSTLAFSIIANDYEPLKRLPSDMFNIMPYLITLIALVVFSGKNYAPASVGLPYEGGSS
ncbi:ABC transporter permease [Treponema phagedenis]|uniref:ABC transporter permease n=1 Tax=Treponema phagedenis TaxID=162 RepID=A0A0B7GW75_TREPH|nr:ABC transporter permease [Treponema phagedenis]NVP24664.1 ABC transporter permease [Treponema phagedenis]QEJ97586.1 ABC transporter permease [Treponema phagedenis]QEK00553.1 ABC transporter permease [Treponema phagedenis]QEK03152.1 ABC transporter permease [Treponema phagedenis]QEK05561.1 ABC transporter permease [Treponema phagedenis]